MYDTVASGFVADELPKDLVSKFLARIQQSEQEIYGYSQNEEPKNNHNNNYNTNNMMGHIDKKR